MWRTNWGNCFSSCRLAVNVLLPRATCFPACMHIVSFLRPEVRRTHAQILTHTDCATVTQHVEPRPATVVQMCVRAHLVLPNTARAAGLRGEKEDLDEDEYESTKQAKILNVSSLVALHSKYARTLTVENF
jgi:hypothetical protein